MKIASADLQMVSSHASLQHHEIRESLHMWSGRQRPDDGQKRPEVELSEAGRAASANADDLDEMADNDPRLLLIRIMFEALTGQKMKVFDPAEVHSGQAPATPSAPAPERRASSGFGIDYQRRESYSEIETTRFSASGMVRTADGREIQFSLELEMSRSYYEESSTRLQLGDAARKIDPLVINYGGSAASLDNQRFAFDLNADGTPEQIAGLGAGSGYLAFDRNGNGTIDDGSELFGPQSGDGFAELAWLDNDGNGWIDENDAAFGQLSLWSGNGSGQSELRSLGEAGIGAIALSRIASPFDLKDNENGLLGQIRSSGIFLHEDGTAGTIQQIDLTA